MGLHQRILLKAEQLAAVAAMQAATLLVDPHQRQPWAARVGVSIQAEGKRL
jgi:hypothetical protein